MQLVRSTKYFVHFMRILVTREKHLLVRNDVAHLCRQRRFNIEVPKWNASIQDYNRKIFLEIRCTLFWHRKKLLYLYYWYILTLLRFRFAELNWLFSRVSSKGKIKDAKYHQKYFYYKILVFQITHIPVIIRYKRPTDAENINYS